MLSGLTMVLADSWRVKETLRDINLATSRREEYVISIPHRAFRVIVKRKVSHIISDAKQFPLTRIDTEDLITLLKDLQKFLEEYEQGLIPGITKQL